MEKSGPSDPELLAEWLEQHREAAFRTLVTRYAGLVLMTARRTCGGDDAMAAEASQLTFLLLARKAKSLLTCASFGGWLHRSALMHSKNLLRAAQSETRKRGKLRDAMNSHPPAPTPDDPWQELKPVLDEALATLPAKYREAILLRFYRSLGVREIGETLGISTDAAQKRIDRGTSRLRARLASLGCPVAGTSLGALLLAGFTADAKAAAVAGPLIAGKVLAASAAGSGTAAGSSTFITTLSVKAGSYAIPATLALAIAWLISQRLAMAKLEDGNATLSATLASTSVPARLPASRKNVPTALDKKPVDWNEVARQLSEYEGGGVVYLTAKLPLLDDFRAMSREELLAAFEEVAAANLDQYRQDAVEMRLYQCLLSKDPPTALSKALERGYSKRNELFGTWAEKDPAGAGAWLDGQIASAAWGGKSMDDGWNLRLGFEEELVLRLIATDPGAASLRMSALPETMRRHVFEQQGSRVKTKDWAAFARVLHEQLPAGQRLPILKFMVVWGDDTTLAEMHDFLAQSEATAEERRVCVIAFAQGGEFFPKVMLGPDPEGRVDRRVATAGDFDSLRAWLRRDAPGLLEEASAAAFKSLLNDMSYQDVVELALHCHADGGGDEVLVAVVDSPYASRDLKLARSVAAKLSDPAKRQKVMKQLGQ